MARKSRKTNRAVQPEPVLQSEEIKKIPTVVYCRLSKADEITGRDAMATFPALRCSYHIGK